MITNRLDSEGLQEPNSAAESWKAGRIFQRQRVLTSYEFIIIFHSNIFFSYFNIFHRTLFSYRQTVQNCLKMWSITVFSGVLDPSKIFKLTLWHSKKRPKYSHNIHPIYLQPIGPKYVLNMERNKHILQCFWENNRKPLSYLLWFIANFTLLNFTQVQIILFLWTQNGYMHAR